MNQRREQEERILRPACEALNIDEDIANLSLIPCRDYARIFPGIVVFGIGGGIFERPALPGSSYMYVAHDPDSESAFIELAPGNSSLIDLLTKNIGYLTSMEPTLLADFVLTIQTPSTVCHEVLGKVDELSNESRLNDGFVLSEDAKQLVTRSEHSTTMRSSPESVNIEALTLFGWMHEKQNLGFTEIRIAPGDLQIGGRQTICEPVFESMPNIWY